MPKIPFWVFLLLAVMYFSAARVDTMDVDASQYAEMSREMSISKDYLHLYDRGHNYLDKPPFLFWVSSASMQVFGVNNFAYKFPSVLFALLALFALYRLTKLLYDEATGRMAALILGCSQGLFLWTNDVRCDTILMSFVITSIWLLQEWLVKQKMKYLIGAFAAVAFGMMTKGPVALMVPVFCFACDWALKRQWKNFFKWQYLLGIVVIAVLLIPMSIGLYQQYDMHPKIIMDGKSGISGLRFFYWTQSFGRITGENEWKNGADFFFLLQSMAWAFLPWMVLFVVGLFVNIKELVTQRFKLKKNQEWLSTGGFLITYCSLAISKYQLPHYIFVVFPLASIIVAKLIRDFIAGGKYKSLYRFMKTFQVVIMALVFAVVLILLVYVFPLGITGAVVWLIALGLWLGVAVNKKIRGKILWVSAAGIIIANVFVTHHFYYHLLQYQMGSQAGRVVRQMNIPAKDIMTYKVNDPMNSLHFYAQRVIKKADTITDVTDKQYVIVTDKGLADINNNGRAYDIVNKNAFFKVSELTPEFLNPKTRNTTLTTYYILKMKK